MDKINGDRKNRNGCDNQTFFFKITTLEKYFLCFPCIIYVYMVLSRNRCVKLGEKTIVGGIEQIGYILGNTYEQRTSIKLLGQDSGSL